jgi:hypothetical protein
MEAYVIRRDDGQYVTPPGSEKSYTADVTKARIFRSREEAKIELCPGNETVVPLLSVFQNSPLFRE